MDKDEKVGAELVALRALLVHQHKTIAGGTGAGL
jgi:hypothetical protein